MTTPVPPAAPAAADSTVPRVPATTGESTLVQPAPHAVGSTADQVVRAVVRHWPVVILTAAAVMLLAWLFASVQPKRYRVTAVGAVAPMVEGLTTTDVIRGVDSLERRVIISTVAALAAAPATRREALGQLHGYSISSSVVPNTNLFNIIVEGGDAKQVAAVANRIPSLVSGQTAAMFKLYRVTLISPATPPDEAILPRVSRAAIAGLLLGLVAGVAIAWLLDQRHRLPFLSKATS